MQSKNEMMAAPSDIFKVDQIEELLSSELSYLNSLRTLQSVLDRSRGNIVPQLSACIGEFITISETLVENLFALKNTDLSEDERNQLRKERTGILKLFFIFYQNYAPLFDKIIRLTNNPDGPFAKLIEEVYLQDKIGLASILIMPVQRGPRYVLLLRDALKAIDKIATKSSSKSDLPLSEEDTVLPISKKQLSEMQRLLEACEEQMKEANAKMPSYDPKKQEVRPYQFGDYTCSALAYFGLYSFESEDELLLKEKVVVVPTDELLDEDSFILLEVDESTKGKDSVEEKTEIEKVENSSMPI